MFEGLFIGGVAPELMGLGNLDGGINVSLDKVMV